MLLTKLIISSGANVSSVIFKHNDYRNSFEKLSLNNLMF